MSPDLDRDLIARSLAEDGASFERLIAGRLDRLSVLAHRFLRVKPAAEDAVQAALMEGWRDLGQLRDPDRLDAWLHRLVVYA